MIGGQRLILASNNEELACSSATTMEETIPDGGVPGVAVFKKPSRKRRSINYRHHRLSREDEEEEEAEKGKALSSVNEPVSNVEQERVPIHNVNSNNLQVMLEEQRSRAKGKRKGVDLSALLKGPSRETEKQPTLAVNASNSDGPLDGEDGGESAELPGGIASKSLTTMMDNQFKSGGEALGRPKSVPHQDIMEAYVQAELEKSQGRSVSKEKMPNIVLTEEDQLYVIPEDVKKNVEEARRHYGTNANADDDTGGAQLAWNTGIAEVELPDLANQKTIELTRQAVKHMRKRGNHSIPHIPGPSAVNNFPNTKSVRSSAVPANIASNFNLHQKEYIMRARENSQRNKADEGEKVTTVGETRADWKFQKRHPFSNDDAAVAKHIKRMRR